MGYLGRAGRRTSASSKSQGISGKEYEPPRMVPCVRVFSALIRSTEHRVTEQKDKKRLELSRKRNRAGRGGGVLQTER